MTGYRFQFVIAVWGDKFIDQMCEVCLPCVLAPGNLPAIPDDERFRFVFVTRAADVPRLKSEPLLQKLQDLIEVRFLEFDPADYKSAHLALSAAHRMALVMAAQEAAHFVLLDPDLVFSDNTLASARRIALTGKSAIMVSGLRLTSETAIPVLREGRITETYAGNPILAPRNLMRFALQHFHPEVARYCFDSSQFTQWPLVCLWPVGSEGFLDRSFHLHPLVLDMRTARPEALATLDHDTIDGAYVFHAFPDWSKIHVEGDSDNMLVFSFSSMHENVEPPRNRHASKRILIETAYMFNVNALHRHYFKHAIKLHSGDLDSRWHETEKNTAHLARYFLWYLRYFRLIDLSKRLSGIPVSWEEFQARGRRREAKADHTGAAKDFARAIDLGPPNTALHFQRGVSLTNALDRSAALEEFQAGLKLDPNNATLRALHDALAEQVFQERGLQRDAEGDHLGAAEDFANAIKIAPDNPTLRLFHGMALLQSGDRSQAELEFKVSLELDPSNAVLHDLVAKHSTAPTNQTRWQLIKSAARTLWENNERIKTRLKECINNPTSRARVRWRVYQTTAIILGRPWLKFTPPRADDAEHSALGTQATPPRERRG